LEMMLAQERSDVLEENDGGNALEPGVRVRKMLSDIPQRRGPQKRIGDRVAEHIGIRVPYQPFDKRNLDSSENKFPVDHKSVNVISDTESHERYPRISNPVEG